MCIKLCQSYYQVEHAVILEIFSHCMLLYVNKLISSARCFFIWDMSLDEIHSNTLNLR